MSYDIKINGIFKTNIQYFAALENHCKFDKLTEETKKDFDTLIDSVKKASVNATGTFITCYRYFSPKTMDAMVTNAISIEQSGIVKMKQLDKTVSGILIIPALPHVLKITLTGSYEHIVEAWGIALKHIASNNICLNDYYSPWESFLNREEKNTSKQITEIYLPLTGETI